MEQPLPQRPSILLPALYGGIVIGIISGVPILNFINCACCAGVLFGGAMAVFFFKKDLPPEFPLTNSDAIQVGALAGVFGAIIGTALSAMVMAAFGNFGREFIQEAMENMKDQMPPEAFDRFMQGFAQGGRGGGFVIFGLIWSLVVDTIFGLLGGLIGFAIFKPKPPAPFGPPAGFPPQPPASPQP